METGSVEEYSPSARRSLGSPSLPFGLSVQRGKKVKVMSTRTDFPLGGDRRKAERQRDDRLRKRKLDRVAEAFERRSRSRERSDRP